MDSNTYSNRPPGPPEYLARSEPPGPPERLEWPESPQLPEPLEWLEPPAGLEDVAELTAVLDELAARDLERLPVLIRAQRVRALQQLASRLHGQWLKELAGVDALGAAGAGKPGRATVPGGCMGPDPLPGHRARRRDGADPGP